VELVPCPQGSGLSSSWQSLDAVELTSMTLSRGRDQEKSPDAELSCRSAFTMSSPGMPEVEEACGPASEPKPKRPFLKRGAGKSRSQTPATVAASEAPRQLRLRSSSRAAFEQAAQAVAAWDSSHLLDFTARQYLKSEQLDSSCTLIDVAICKAKGFLEGPHFLLGLGDRIDEGMAAIERMKRTAAREVKVEWRSNWEQRESQLSGRNFWVRRGAFESPIAELLPEGARNATVWEVRGTAPVDCQRELADANADVMLPINTVWLGLTPVDRCIDTVVRLLNVSASQVPVDDALGKQTAIVILPDFGGEFCKRTMPLAELVSARLPAASVFLLEMPLRGTRKPPGYLGALPSVHDMMLMGCAIIEESRSLIGWLKISGFDHV
ncbi:unnamed protein product, partial [Polarella glacialis]